MNVHKVFLQGMHYEPSDPATVLDEVDLLTLTSEQALVIHTYGGVRLTVLVPQDAERIVFGGLTTEERKCISHVLVAENNPRNYAGELFEYADANVVSGSWWQYGPHHRTHDIQSIELYTRSDKLRTWHFGDLTPSMICR